MNQNIEYKIKDLERQIELGNRGQIEYSSQHNEWNIQTFKTDKEFEKFSKQIKKYGYTIDKIRLFANELGSINLKIKMKLL